MGIAPLPRQAGSTVDRLSPRRKPRRFAHGGDEKLWVRSLAAGSLAAGAILLACGKRKAALVAVAAGSAAALLETPEKAVSVWKSIPGYVQAARRSLDRFETLVDELSRQGDRLRTRLKWEE